MTRRRSLLLALTALGTATALPGCGTGPDTFEGKGPPFRPEEFFAGKLRSHGVFATRLGAIETWFTAHLLGAWDSTKLTFDEHIRYGDSFEERRFWILRRDAADTTGRSWTGEASDATGPVRGEVVGNAFHLQHELNMLTVSGNRRTLGFDQWFLRTTEDMALSRAAVSWYGIQVGTAQLAFQRVSVGVTHGMVYPGQAAREEQPAAPLTRGPGASLVPTPGAPPPSRIMNAPPRR
jgi:hypothetical protein